MLKKILPLAAIIGALTFSTVAKAESTSVFTGFDAKKNSYYLYAGGVTALQGQDILTQDGFLVRGMLGFGQYTYKTVAVPGGSVDGDVYDADLMLGYGHFFDGGSISVYLGPNYENQDLSPNDASNSANGDKVGAKGQLELTINPVANISAGAIGAYSTAYRTYWSQLHAEYDFCSFKLGPEVSFLGNKEYDQQRYGAALRDIDVGFAKTKLYVGWANSDGANSDDSIYGGIGFSRAF